MDKSIGDIMCCFDKLCVMKISDMLGVFMKIIALHVWHMVIIKKP